MSDSTRIILIVLAILLVIALLFFGCTKMGHAIWNEYVRGIKQTDDATKYEQLKKVEDTCRAMISSYNSDLLTYQQYKDSSSNTEVGWAQQAKMRANKTASTYNNYILKNSYVWANNVPGDIVGELAYIE